jgi:D-3-phosphoglycerate dehydrogenase / 2-oxoglutarate reductase
MTTTERILITPRSLTRTGHPALARLEQTGYELVRCTPGEQPDEAELLRLLPGCVGYLAGVEPVSARVLEEARGLKAISRNGTGVNNIDLEAARRLNIAVLRADGANARGVAELTVALTLALVRHLPFSDRHLKTGDWQRRQGIEIAGRTLGLIGCGKIGQIVTEMAVAMGMDVIGYDPLPNAKLAATPGFRYAALEAVVDRADVLSLHCPPAADGQPLMNRQRLARMKPGAYLVNTARGELLDDAAVLEALDRGTLAGVAVDAFRKEPPGMDPLVQHEKVIAVPHVGAYTEESVARAVEVAVDNLLEVLHCPSPTNC